LAQTEKEPLDVAELVLIRHGETEWSLSGQHTSVTDIALTDRGEQQAQALATTLKSRHFAAIFSSPRQRAWRTAALAGLGPVQIDDALVEWDYGAYEGRTTAQISAELGYEWSLWSEGVIAGSTPGETAQQVQQRANRFIEHIRPTLDNGQDVAAVAHGHILRVIAATWLSLPAEAGALFCLSTGSISSLGFEHGRPTMTGWNHVPSS
jgi:probable phosphoglycerate mutase